MDSDGWRGSEGIPIAFPVSRYVWESTLDASLPQGASAFIPSPWLLAELGFRLISQILQYAGMTLVGLHLLRPREEQMALGQ